MVSPDLRQGGCAGALACQGHCRIDRGTVITMDVPQDVAGLLETGFVGFHADQIIDRGGVRGDVMHVGDPVGTVFAWLWQQDPNRCMMRLAELLAQLRDSANAPVPPIRLTDLIEGFQFAWPHDFTDAEQQAFTQMAAATVQGYYGRDPNE